MKKILAFSCILSLLSTTGCLVSGGGHGHGHGHGRGHGRGHGVKHSSSAVVVPAIVVPSVRVRVD